MVPVGNARFWMVCSMVKPSVVAFAEDTQPLAVEAAARIAMDVPMKGLSAKSITTPTNVPVAPAIESDNIVSMARPKPKPKARATAVVAPAATAFLPKSN